MAITTIRRARKTMRMTAGRKKRRSRKFKKPKKTKKKKKRPATAWNKHMMMVYKSMKAKDPSVKLGAAMKEAKKTYKKGRA